MSDNIIESSKKMKKPIIASAPSEEEADNTIMEEPWQHILDCIGYNDSEYIYITADDIKKAGKTWNGKANQFEPRLLAYQTSSNSRPDIFKSKNLYLLPVQNGTYMITKTNVYKQLEYDEVPITMIDKNKDSLILSFGNSETSLIDNLRYSGVFERDEILGEPILYGPLLNGRHRCTFDMMLDELNINIQGVQFEVDSCFESKNKILLIEGKSSTKPIDSFNIRQLYFPFRVLKNVVGDKKEIICAFIHELKSNIHVWTYTFERLENMDSIKLIGHYIYNFNS
jgi:hypothetical protein